MNPIAEAWRRIPLLRFLIVGGLNTAFAFGIYTALVLSGLPFVLANLIALVTGIVVTFKSNARLVFQRNGGSFIRYLVLWSVVFVVQNVIIWKVTTVVTAPLLYGLVTPEVLGGAIALLITIPVSFFAQAGWVYRLPREDKGKLPNKPETS